VPELTRSVFKQIFANKKINVVTSETFNAEKELTAEKVYSTYHSNFENDDTRVVHVFVTIKYLKSIMGSTLDSSGVAINSRTILIQYPAAYGCRGCTSQTEHLYENFLMQINPITSRKLFTQIVMHETGHLLGLRHRPEKGCVMSPFVAKNNFGLIRLSDAEVNKLISDEINTKYCDKEMELIKEITDIPLVRTGSYENSQILRAIDVI
jgi:predicted Zn-dependent protease